MEIISRDEAIKLGRKRYFTGKPCKHGHIDERTVSSKGCLECVRITNRTEEKKAYKRRHKEENIEKYKMRQRKRYEEKREEIIEYAKKWSADNPGAVVERVKAWRESNPGKTRALRSSWNFNRRSKQDSSIAASDMRAWRNSAPDNCFWCGVDINEEYHADHFVPISAGGANNVQNLVTSCPDCNMRKHAKMPGNFCIGRYL